MLPRAVCLAVIVVSGLLLVAQPRLASAQCTGDCNSDGLVTIDEIIRAVNIALGTTPVDECLAADADSDGAVTIDEILQAVIAALGVCRPVVSGICLAPGGGSVVPCQAGRQVRVFRCDDVTACLDSPEARTLLGETVLDQDGQFSLQLAAETMGRPLIFEAVIDDAGTTIRDFGLAGAVSAQSRRASSSSTAGTIIDPSSEGAVRALDVIGLPNVTESAALGLSDSVRRESALNQVYSGLSNHDALVVGGDIAADVLFVQPGRLVLNADDTELFMTSQTDRSIARLARAAMTGALRPVQIIGNDAMDSSVDFARPLALAASPDAASAYVVDAATSQTDGSLFVFSRPAGTGGDLHLLQSLAFGQGALGALVNPTSVAIVPDGTRVFVDGQSNLMTEIGQFSRDSSGRLNLFGTTSVGTFDVNVVLLKLAPPAGQQLYVVLSNVESEIFVLSRINNSLSVAQTVSGLGEVFGLALSPDGSSAYALENFADGSATLSPYARDRLSGTLATLSGAQHGPAPATDVTVSPDGKNVYVSGLEFNPDLRISQTSVTAFDRDTQTGALSQPRTLTVLGRDVVRGATEALPSSAGIPAVAVSNDGRNVYVSSAADNAIAVFARAASTGDLQLQALTRVSAERLPSPPASDACAAATEIAGFPLTDSLDTVAASVSLDDPALSCGAGGQQGHSVWYRFTAPGTGIVAISTTESAYDTVLAVHSGTCGRLTELACNDDNFADFSFSGLRVPVRAGMQYFVEVTNRGLRPGGLLQLRAAFGPRLCAACQSSSECGQGSTCFRCQANCAAGAPDRCGVQGFFIDCQDGAY